MKMLAPGKSETILDAGCGGGFFTYEIAKKCKISVGIDWKLDKGLSLAIDQQSTVTYVIGDVQKLPFGPEGFDKILLSSVLQMVEDDRAVLMDCYRVLKGKGALVLSVPTGYYFIKELNHFKSKLKKKFGARGRAYYDLSELTELLQNEGFEVAKIEYSPKKLGSLIFEMGLLLWCRFGFPFFSPFLFCVFYPIVYLDNLGDTKQIGNEVIIKATKVSR
jgi:SAM-dependent methyltransferase